MFNLSKDIKGVHPGLILQRELDKRKISKSRFALMIQEYPQTLGAITNGKRDMNTGLALRIEEALNLEEGFLMMLQVFYDIKKLRLIAQQTPNLKVLRPALFWDTDVNKIDWHKQKKAIIKRAWERGNEQEKAEIERFYGEDAITEALA